MRLLVVHCAAHKLNPGLSSSVELSCSVCQEKSNCCFQFVSWHLICLHVELCLANVDKGIANSVCNTFLTEGHNKATKCRPQGRCGKKAALCPWLNYSVCVFNMNENQNSLRS